MKIALAQIQISDNMEENYQKDMLSRSTALPFLPSI